MNDLETLQVPLLGPEGYDPYFDERDGEFYDRSGNPITMREWMSLRQWDALVNDSKYKILSQDLVDDYFVSTVWLGMNMSFGDGPPLIFETMVFRESTGESDLECRRYTSEEDALEGHAEVLKQAKVIAELER